MHIKNETEGNTRLSGGNLTKDSLKNQKFFKKYKQKIHADLHISKQRCTFLQVHELEQKQKIKSNAKETTKIKFLNEILRCQKKR